jgi:hypothetical protein
VAIVAIAAVAIFYVYFKQKRGLRERSQFVPQNSTTPESDRDYPRTPGEELAELRDSSKKVYENPAVPVRSELDGMDQQLQQTPLMELEASERELRPVRPPGDNLPQRVEL